MGTGNLSQVLSKATTSSADLALQIVRSALSTQPHAGSKHTIPVNLPRRDHPLYLLPGNRAQPWGLLPMKAAAYAQYPNFFNNSSSFFGSINRDIKLSRPCSIIRVTKVALDLAKVMRNLGIIASYQVGQKLDLVKNTDYVWNEDLEPEHASELALYKYKYLKLNLRWDLFKPVWESTSATLSQTPMSVPEALPLSVKNISRASQPVFMTPKVLKQEHQSYASGIFLVYHHQLGITTDATAQLMNVPGLVMAHLGLPYSHVTQIHAAMKQKLVQERERGIEQTVPLRDWSMVEFVHKSLEQRAQEVSVGPEVERQRAEIRQLVDRHMREDEALLSNCDISSTLHKELLAWQLKDKLTTPAPSELPQQAEQRQGLGYRSSDGPSRWPQGSSPSQERSSSAQAERSGRQGSGRQADQQGRQGDQQDRQGDRQSRGQQEQRWSRVQGDDRRDRAEDRGRGRDGDGRGQGQVRGQGQFPSPNRWRQDGPGRGGGSGDGSRGGGRGPPKEG